MASGRSARLPPTPQQGTANSAPVQIPPTTATFLSTNSAGTIRYDVSPNNNHPALTSAGSHHQPQQLQHRQDLILDNDNSAAHSFDPELAAATSQVLDSLSDRERRIIINVLKRDDNVRQRDAARIMWVTLPNVAPRDPPQPTNSLTPRAYQPTQRCERHQHSRCLDKFKRFALLIRQGILSSVQDGLVYI